jgi:hypothetical protein
MIETDADRLASIKGLGGQLVSSEIGEFWAIFDNDYVGSIDEMVEGRGPALTCRTSDVEQLKRLAVIQVGSVSYKLNKAEPDGTGMSVLFLGR